MGFKKTLRKWAFGSLKGQHPNSINALQQARERREHEQVRTMGSIHGGNQGGNKASEGGGEHTEPIEMGLSSNEEEGGDVMDMKQFFSMMREMKDYDATILKAERERTMALKEEMAEASTFVESAQADDPINELAMTFGKTMLENWSKSSPPAQVPGIITPSEKMVSNNGQVSLSELLTVDEAYQLAEAVNQRIPESVRKMVLSGAVDENTAVNYIVGMGLTPDNAVLVYDAFMGKLPREESHETVKEIQLHEKQGQHTVVQDGDVSGKPSAETSVSDNESSVS